MKKLVFSLLLVLAFSAIILPTACNREVESPAQTPVIAAAASPCTQIMGSFQANRGIVQDRLESIALGLIDMAGDNSFTTLVQNETAAKAVDHDFIVKLHTCDQACQASGGNLRAQMRQSVLAHGGSQQDCNVIDQSLCSFTLGGILYEPTLYVPYYDGVNNHNGWDMKTPSYITTIFSQQGNGMTGWDTQGNPVFITDQMLDSSPVWMVGIKRLCDDGQGGVLPLAPKAQCYCLHKPFKPTVEDCQLTASTKTCGRADRQGQCHNTCGSTGSGGGGSTK